MLKDRNSEYTPAAQNDEGGLCNGTVHAPWRVCARQILTDKKFYMLEKALLLLDLLG